MKIYYPVSHCCNASTNEETKVCSECLNICKVIYSKPCYTCGAETYPDTWIYSSKLRDVECEECGMKEIRKVHAVLSKSGGI